MKKLWITALCMLLYCTGCGADPEPDGIHILTPPDTTAADTAGTDAAHTAEQTEATAAASADEAAQADGGTSETAAQTDGSPADQADDESSAAAVQSSTAQSTSAQTTTAATVNALDAASAERDRCLSVMNAAKTALETAQTALNTAKTALTTAEQARDAYSAAHKDELDLYGKGSLGFFTYVGAAEAVDVLQNAKYASSTVLGNNKDATSLENMRKSFDFMRECNELRASEGLSALRVTDKLMAIAQSNLNWSDKNVQHSQQFNVGENLAWNYADPFKGWYDDEKASQGGHYLNIINSSYQVTGFAVCTAGRSGAYSVSHGQVFYFSSSEPSYTVDEYEKRLAGYEKAVGAAASQMTSLESAAEKAAAQVQTCTAALTQAQNTYTKAQQAYQNAQAAYDKLKSSGEAVS